MTIAMTTLRYILLCAICLALGYMLRPAQIIAPYHRTNVQFPTEMTPLVLRVQDWC